MLSLPLSCAKGCSYSYSRSSTAPFPLATSTTPTYRSFFPFAFASSVRFVISSSYSGSAAMNASTDSVSRRGSGTRDCTGMSSSSRSKPHSRARMTTLRATSVPLRSSRGSGSVYPSSFAVLTTSENARPSPKVLKM